MTKPRALTTIALLGTVAALSVLTAPAAAAAPCWKRLVNDWYDGRIDKAYNVACYRAAIKNLPDDVRAYSDARDDIERALNQAIRTRGSGAADPTDVIEPEPGPPAETETSGETVETNGAPDADDEGEGDGGEAAPPPDDDGGPLAFLEPSNADAIPLPLLILAGLAMLLLALAGGGFVTKRVQERRARLSPRPPDEPS